MWIIFLKNEIRYHEIRYHVSMAVDVSSHNPVKMSPMCKTTTVSHVPASIKTPHAVSGSLFLVTHEIRYHEGLAGLVNSLPF